MSEDKLDVDLVLRVSEAIPSHLRRPLHDLIGLALRSDRGLLAMISSLTRRELWALQSLLREGGPEMRHPDAEGGRP